MRLIKWATNGWKSENPWGYGYELNSTCNYWFWNGKNYMHNKGQIESITFGKSKYQDRSNWETHLLTLGTLMNFVNINSKKTK